MSTDFFDSKMGLRFKVGEEVKTYSDKRKIISGIITEVGNDSIEVKWDDLTEPTEYERCKIEMEGDLLIELP